MQNLEVVLWAIIIFLCVTCLYDIQIKQGFVVFYESDFCVGIFIMPDDVFQLKPKHSA